MAKVMPLHKPSPDQNSNIVIICCGYNGITSGWESRDTKIEWDKGAGMNNEVDSDSHPNYHPLKLPD